MIEEPLGASAPCIAGTKGVSCECEDGKSGSKSRTRSRQEGVRSSSAEDLASLSLSEEVAPRTR